MSHSDCFTPWYQSVDDFNRAISGAFEEGRNLHVSARWIVKGIGDPGLWEFLFLERIDQLHQSSQMKKTASFVIAEEGTLAVTNHREEQRTMYVADFQFRNLRLQFSANVLIAQP